MVKKDSHRGRVCEALSEDEWMDCHEVANAIGYSFNGASRVLSDVHRAGYVERRESQNPGEIDYEYKLKPNVRIE